MSSRGSSKRQSANYGRSRTLSSSPLRHYHGTGVASDKVDTEIYKAFNQAVYETVRRIKPMFVYEAMSRRPISTNMLAKTGSRKRSEMRVAR